MNSEKSGNWQTLNDIRYINVNLDYALLTYSVIFAKIRSINQSPNQ